MRASRAEQVSPAVNPCQATVLGNGARVCDGSSSGGRDGAHEGAVTANVFCDDERLALELEALCVKRLAQQRISINKQ